MFESEGLKVLQKNDYSRIGKMGYRLLVPKEKRDTEKIDSVAVANRLYRSPLTDGAAPSFLPLYPMQMSASPTNDTYWAAPGEPNYTQLPNGTDHAGSWNLDIMKVPEAWDIVYGPFGSGERLSDKLDSGAEVVVAQMDNGTGINYTRANGTGVPPGFDPESQMVRLSGEMSATGHDDLRDNTWINDAEVDAPNVPGVSGPGVDDDGNGMIDDFFGWDFSGSDPANIGGSPDEDNVPYPDYVADPLFQATRWHGTATAGLAAARGDNGISFTGVCPDAKIMAVRYEYNLFVHNTDDVWRVGQAEAALNYVAGKERNGPGISETKADVIMFMFASRVYDPGLHLAIQFARSRDIPIVLPAGNDDSSLDALPFFPQVFPEVITVGAIDPNQNILDGCDPSNPIFATRSFFEPQVQEGFASNYGYAVDMVTPSVNYRDTGPPHFKPLNTPGPAADSVGTGGTGTSSSMPQAGGVIALMLKAARNAGKELAAAEIQDILQRTAQDIQYCKNRIGQDEAAVAGRDRYTGWGLLDAEAAVKEAELSRFRVQDGTGKFLFSMAENGRFVIDGEVVESSSPQQLSEDGAKGEFIVRDSAGEIVARAVNEGTGVDTARLYLKGSFTYTDDMSSVPSTLSLPSGVSSFVIDHYDNTGARIIDAYIDENGNFSVRGKIFEAAKADAPNTYTVGPIGSGADKEGPGGIQAAINDSSIPNNSIIEVLPGTYDPITFPVDPPRDLVIRSKEYWDFSKVGQTIIEGTGMDGNGTVIQFGGNESENCAIQGFTIRGGSAVSGSGIRGSTAFDAPVSSARIMFNHIYGNVAETADFTRGGAIWRHVGRIQFNVFGKDPLEAPTAYGGNVAKFGAALRDCFGSIQNNIFWYNGDSTTISGGALYWCHEVQSNFFAFNEADYGGAMMLGGGYVTTPSGNEWGVVRGNILYSNTAHIEGGGSQAQRGRWENNTIYDNTAPTGSGMSLDFWDAEFVNQNNILWANGSGSQIEGTGAGNIVYSAIDETVNPGGAGNIGPFSGMNDPKFLSTTFNTADPNWDTFLHLDNASNTNPLVDAGQPNVDAYADEVKIQFGTPPDDFDYVFQWDFDRQWAPVDVQSQGTDFDIASPSDTIPMDIGADEWPTDPANFVFWWEER